MNADYRRSLNASHQSEDAIGRDGNVKLTFLGGTGVLFRAVTAARLLAAFNAGGVLRAADDLITNARKVANTTAANEDDRVLLQFVTFAGNVDGNFFAVREANARDTTERGIRLLRSHGADGQADAAFLGATFKNRGLGRAVLLLTVFTNQLIDCRH